MVSIKTLTGHGVVRRRLLGFRLRNSGRSSQKASRRLAPPAGSLEGRIPVIFSHHHLYKSWNMNLNSIVSEKKRFVKGQNRKREKNLRAGRREGARMPGKREKT